MNDLCVRFHLKAHALILQIYGDFEQHVYNTLTKEMFDMSSKVTESQTAYANSILFILYRICFRLCSWILFNLRK